jgi:hypothetical protein
MGCCKHGDEPSASIKGQGISWSVDLLASQNDVCSSTQTFVRQRGYYWPPLWSSGQSSWLQIQRSGFDSRFYQIFREVVGLERGPLSLVSTIKEILGRNNSGSGLEIRGYGRRNPSRWPRGTLNPQTLAQTSPIIGGRSVGIVRPRTQATKFSLLLYRSYYSLHIRVFRLQPVFRSRSLNYQWRDVLLWAVNKVLSREMAHRKILWFVATALIMQDTWGARGTNLK